MKFYVIENTIWIYNFEWITSKFQINLCKSGRRNWKWRALSTSACAFWPFWLLDFLSGLTQLVTVMLVTSLCWWIYDGDWFQNHYVGDFFRYVGDFLNVLNRSSTSWIGHQHLKIVTNTFGRQHPSPTSM